MARRRPKNLSLRSFVKDVQTAVWMDRIAEKFKPYMKTLAKEAMLAIPTSGTGYLAKKTTVTSGRGKAPPSRMDTRMAQLRLGRRRTGSSQGNLQKSIQTAQSKIDRMKDERLAKILQKDKGTLMTLSYGTYYSKMVSPRYDSARRKLPKVVQARLKSKQLKR